MGNSSQKRPAVFLDRDGTLVEEVDHLSRPADLRVFPYSLSALKLLKDLGFLLIVITNQSGIGRGYFTESDMTSVHRAIDNELPGMLDGYYFCPHLPDAGCVCRKPGTGMFEAAFRDYEIDRDRSWMVGDKSIDVEAGTNAGLRSILTLTGYGSSNITMIDPNSVMVARDLLDAAQTIVSLIEADPAFGTGGS